MVLLLNLVLISLATLIQQAATAQTPNEFIVQASNYDKLESHSNNCTFAIESDFAFTFCEDGYIAIDETRNMLNPNTAFKINAKWAQTLP